jgi:hypothetical protein
LFAESIIIEITIFFNLESELLTMEVSMEFTRSPEFKQVYAIGAIGGHSPYDFRIAFYNDSPKVLVDSGKQMTVMEREIKTEIILSPLAAKELATWLDSHLKDYEKLFGEIKKPGMPDSIKPEATKSTQIQGYM